MTMVEPDEILPEPAYSIAGRAANEGIPVYAIARMLRAPADIVYDTLSQLRDIGTIAEVPKADWPPTARAADRLPVAPRTCSDEDMRFGLLKLFRLTPLEASFLMMLVKYERVDKAKLHNVVETQRMARASRPEDTELTDPKMVDVMICKLRKKLKTVDIRVVITTIWGDGYYIEPATKQLIASLLTGVSHDPQSQRAAAPVAAGRPANTASAYFAPVAPDK